MLSSLVASKLRSARIDHLEARVKALSYCDLEVIEVDGTCRDHRELNPGDQLHILMKISYEHRET